MAADIQKIILTIADLKLIRELQVNLKKMDIHFSKYPEVLELADNHIEKTLSNSKSPSKSGIAISNVSSSITESFILSCDKELSKMQCKLESLLKCLDHQPINPGQITECCEDFLLSYEYFIPNFNLLFKLLVEITNSDRELKLMVLDLDSLVKRISETQDLYAKEMDVLSFSPNELMFSDFASSSSSSDLASSLDSHRKKPNSKTSQKEVCSGSSFIEEIIWQTVLTSSKTKSPKAPLSVQSQNTVSMAKKEPLNAVDLLSEMYRKASDLFINIESLCINYKKLHHGKENKLYIAVMQKLARISRLIDRLEENLETRTKGLIKNDSDCFKYESRIQFIVTEMRAIIQDPSLSNEMLSIYDSIARNTANRASETECKIRDSSKISRTNYANIKEELCGLCNTVGSATGVVRKDIEEMKKTIKEQITDSEEIDKQVTDSEETDKQIIDDGLVFGSLEIAPSTDSLKSVKSSESVSSQFFSSQNKVLAAEKHRERPVAVKPTSKETTPAAQFEPIIFTKMSFNK